jgi:hypothetical protein
VLSSDLPGVNPTTLNGMILYYRLMTKWSGLGDCTELSRMGLSQSLREIVSSPGLGFTGLFAISSYVFFVRSSYFFQMASNFFC